jgi:putative transposase
VVWAPLRGVVRNINLDRGFSTTVRGYGGDAEGLWSYGATLLQPGVRESMADTYLSLRVHLVWATKNRRPWLDPEWRSRLFASVAAVVARQGGELLCAGGTRDHIHLYLEPPSTLALSDLVASIKTTTTKWIHGTFAHRRDFRWQHGYGAFSVTPFEDSYIRDYIRNQEIHHREERFANEYTSLLQRHGVIFDRRT